MNKIICVLILLFVCMAFAVFVLMCIDKEVARREYVANVYPVENCLFDFNCKHYNKLAEEE